MALNIRLHIGWRHQANGVAERLELARPMMRRGARFDADQTRWQLLKECQHVAPLELTADDDIASRIDAMNLKDRLRNVETECRDRLHVWLLRIVGALTASTYVALPCRWRSRPQHQLATSCRVPGHGLHGRRCI